MDCTRPLNLCANLRPHARRGGRCRQVTAMGKRTGERIRARWMNEPPNNFRHQAAELWLRGHAKLEPHAIFDYKLVSRILGWGLLAASLLPLNQSRRLALRLVALRRFDQGAGLGLSRSALARWLTPARAPVWRENRIGWQRYEGTFADINREPALTTSLLLKEPGADGEKGVLYSSFEYNWMKILAGKKVGNFFRDYILVGASSWSPSDYAVFANLCGLSRDPAFIGISNPADIPQYRVFSPAIEPVPLMACDFLDPDFFQPRPHSKRTIDILMVAHFARWKRHWLLFEALRHMPRSLRVVLIGRQAPGRTEKELRAEARAFGAPQDLTILSALEIDQVMRYQCDARLCVSFSKREGSCVAVTEALFANAPVAMMRDAHVGARTHINPETGRLVRRENLHYQLAEMLERSSMYSPRAWACQHITAQQSSKKLNAILKGHSTRTGRPWTRDLAPLCWRYVPLYLQANDKKRLRPGVEKLRERHGIMLREFISERHPRGPVT